MKKVSRYLFPLLLVAILALGFFLRYKNHTVIPRPGESMDEYSNAWVGLSLIRLGLPVGRSGLAGYGGNDSRYVNVDYMFDNTAGGSPLGINKPWLDHPPLLGLVTGGYAYLNGARVFEDATTRLIRKPMLAIGVAAVASVFLLTYLVSGWGSAIMAVALFATSPLIVVSSRMGQAENGIIVVFLLCLAMLRIYEKRQKPIFLWLGAFLAGLAILFKVSGLVVPICGGMILLCQKKKKGDKIREVILFETVSFSFLALFFVYGAAYNLHLFLSIWQDNSSRPYDIGYGSLFNILTTTKITVSKYLTDGWPFVGWISLIVYLTKMRGRTFVYYVLPILVYLIFFLFMGSSAYGWYRTPFMPFLFILAAMYFSDGLKMQDKLGPVVLALIPLGININKLSDMFAFAFLKPYWRIGLPLTIGWFFLYRLLPDNYKARLVRFNSVAYLILLTSSVASNVALVYFLTPEYWLKVN